MPDTIKLPEDVERRLKEWSENPDTGLCADFTTDGYAYYEELKIFLADELAIARAEERERVRENLPKIITPTVEPPPNNLSQNQIFASGQMNMLLRVFDLLSSLNKSVTKKD